MGGHAYDSVYTGPIGAVLTPLLDGLEGREHLPFASTLCGACDDACPARVPLSDLLLELRADAAAGGGSGPAAASTSADAPRSTVRPTSDGSRSWELGFKGFAAVSARPRLWDRLLGAAGRSGCLIGAVGRMRGAPRVVRAWTDSRDLPTPAPASFRRLWRRRSRAGSAGGAR
jgi:L-lactate dehydrogenase complex protein LldF